FRGARATRGRSTLACYKTNGFRRLRTEAASASPRGANGTARPFFRRDCLRVLLAGMLSVVFPDRDRVLRALQWLTHALRSFGARTAALFAVRDGSESAGGGHTDCLPIRFFAADPPGRMGSARLPSASFRSVLVARNRPEAAPARAS